VGLFSRSLFIHLGLLCGFLFTCAHTNSRQTLREESRHGLHALESDAHGGGRDTHAHTEDKMSHAQYAGGSGGVASAEEGSAAMREETRDHTARVGTRATAEEGDRGIGEETRANIARAGKRVVAEDRRATRALDTRIERVQRRIARVCMYRYIHV